MSAAEPQENLDVHAPYVQALADTDDWSTLVRYWMAHQDQVFITQPCIMMTHRPDGSNDYQSGWLGHIETPGPASRVMADDYDFSDDDFESYLHCVAARFAGTQDRVKSRRTLLIGYWYQARAFEDYRIRDSQEAAEQRSKLQWLVGAYIQALDTVNERLARESNDELAEIGRTLTTVASEVLNQLRPWLQDDPPASANEAETIERILTRFYAHDDNRRWQAYVFALSAELVPLDNIKSEKSRLGQVADACLGELRRSRHEE